MKSKVTFYHAGCPVCISAEENIARALDPNRYELDIIHLGEKKEKIAEAKVQGVKSVPALILDNQPFHINFGASITDLE